MNDITLLSSPAAVNMADAWFDLATADHFWMRRRFEVFQKLIRPFKLQGAAIAEIGCGAGVVIQQFVESYGSTIDGFDLNIRALQDARTRCPQARLFCYDIHGPSQYQVHCRRFARLAFCPKAALSAGNPQQARHGSNSQEH